jgi:hypothetical protein
MRARVPASGGRALASRRRAIWPPGLPECDPLHGVKRLLEPAAEVPLAGDDVENPHARVHGIHSEAGVYEGSTLGWRKREVHECPRIRAPDPELAHLVQAIDHHAQLLIAEGTIRDLPIGASLLQTFALDLDHSRPPLRMSIDVPNEPPDDLDRGVDHRLLAAVGHRPKPRLRRSNRATGCPSLHAPFIIGAYRRPKVEREGATA